LALEKGKKNGGKKGVKKKKNPSVEHISSRGATKGEGFMATGGV